MSFGQERAKEFRLNKYLFAIFPIYFLATAAASFVVAGSGVKCYFIGRFLLYIYIEALGELILGCWCRC